MAELITVRPGPVLHVWVDGKQAAVVPMTLHAALALLSDLAKEVERCAKL